MMLGLGFAHLPMCLPAWMSAQQHAMVINHAGSISPSSREFAFVFLCKVVNIELLEADAATPQSSYRLLKLLKDALASDDNEDLLNFLQEQGCVRVNLLSMLS
eukprot:480920-Amphidinium_carterae.1